MVRGACPRTIGGAVLPPLIPRERHAGGRTEGERDDLEIEAAGPWRQRHCAADRQRLHRSLQWVLQGGTPERHWFLTLADAAEKLEDWRRYYNEVRSHGATGHKVPISLLNPDGAISQPVIVTPPVRHREKGRKTLPSGGPKNGTGANRGRTLTPSGGKTQWQVTPNRLRHPMRNHGCASYATFSRRALR